MRFTGTFRRKRRRFLVVKEFPANSSENVDTVGLAGGNAVNGRSMPDQHKDSQDQGENTGFYVASPEGERDIDQGDCCSAKAKVSCGKDDEHSGDHGEKSGQGIDEKIAGARCGDTFPAAEFHPEWIVMSQSGAKRSISGHDAAASEDQPVTAEQEDRKQYRKKCL